jgi:hypothetical protein
MGRTLVTSPAVLALLANMNVNPGAGAPARVPGKPGQPPHGDSPNATTLQKLIRPNIQKPATTVFDKTKYGNLNIVSFTLAAAATDVIALLRPSQLRVALLILNGIGSAGVINVGFDVPALGPGGSITLPAGGMIFFDAFVPQNDIHISCNTATSFVAITYCDAPYP